MSTITTEQEASIATLLESCHLNRGLGEGKHKACSVAAINLALTGRLSDDIPDCMSPVIGRWIIIVQDAMPDDLRNSAEWKSLLPLAAGTGRDREKERIAVANNWVFSSVLPELLPIAEKKGFAAEWRNMLEKRTKESCSDAADAAHAAAVYDADAVYTADAADAAHAAAVYDADAVAAAAAYATAAVYAAHAAFSWQRVNPAECLRKMIHA